MKPWNGNAAILTMDAQSKQDAISTFQKNPDGVRLNEDGYAKIGEISYCVAEHWQPY